MNRNHDGRAGAAANIMVNREVGRPERRDSGSIEDVLGCTTGELALIFRFFGNDFEVIACLQHKPVEMSHKSTIIHWELSSATLITDQNSTCKVFKL